MYIHLSALQEKSNKHGQKYRACINILTLGKVSVLYNKWKLLWTDYRIYILSFLISWHGENKMLPHASDLKLAAASAISLSMHGLMGAIVPTFHRFAFLWLKKFNFLPEEIWFETPYVHHHAETFCHSDTMNLTVLLHPFNYWSLLWKYKKTTTHHCETVQHIFQKIIKIQHNTWIKQSVTLCLFFILFDICSLENSTNRIRVVIHLISFIWW